MASNTVNPPESLPPRYQKPLTKPKPFDPKRYFNMLLRKLEARNEEITICEQRAALRTGLLGYKALVAPSSLTPAEVNRCRWMPPPDEVEANIRAVTDGALSTREEFLQKAVDKAEEMTDAELDLIIANFYASESVYELTARHAWFAKLGKSGEAAVDALSSDLQRAAMRRVWAVRNSAGRRAEREKKHDEEVGPVETSEQIEKYHANERRQRERAMEKVKVWDEQDEALQAEAKASMGKLADELDMVECPCERCAKEGTQLFRKTEGGITLPRTEEETTLPQTQ